MDLRFPQDTVWAQPSPHRWLVAAMLVMPLLVLLAGWLLQPMPALAGFGAQLWHALTHAGSYFAACGDFALWQLSWWIDGRLAEGLQLFDSPRWALAADLPLIAAYAYVLSWWAVRGFAWRAGLRQVGAPPDRWLAVLGWALPLAVIGDLAENLATWATLTALGVGRPHLAALLGGLMTLCALAKCLGLAGTLVLAIPPRPWARRAPEVRNSPA